MYKIVSLGVRHVCIVEMPAEETVRAWAAYENAVNTPSKGRLGVYLYKDGEIQGYHHEPTGEQAP